MEIFPQRLVGRGKDGIHEVGGLEGSRQLRLDLRRKVRGAVLVVEAHIHGQVAVSPQPGKDPSLKQRCLAESGHTEEHGEGLALDAPEHLAGLFVAPEEVSLLLLGEGSQPRPWVLCVDGSRARGFLAAEGRTHRGESAPVIRRMR